MRHESELPGLVAGVATFGAFLLASLALIVAASGTSPDTPAAATAGDGVGFGEAWPFVLLMVGAIAGGAGLLAFGARQPAVGSGWPPAVVSGPSEAGRPDEPVTTGRGVERPATSRPPEGGGRDRPSGLEVVSVLMAVTALIVAALALVEAASS